MLSPLPHAIARPLLSVTLLACVLLTACGGGGPTDANTPAKASGDPTLNPTPGGDTGEPTQTVTAPAITAMPASVSVSAGSTAQFTVTLADASKVSYQWYRNGLLIEGENQSSLTTPATTTRDDGARYTVVVSNAAGSQESASATLTVSPSSAGPTDRLLGLAGVQSAGNVIHWANASTSIVAPGLLIVDPLPAHPTVTTLEPPGTAALLYSNQQDLTLSTSGNNALRIDDQRGVGGRYVTYLKQDRLWLLDLRQSTGQTSPRLLTTLDTRSHCQTVDANVHGLVVDDHVHPDNAILVFLNAGADLSCGTADDKFVVVKVTQSASDSPQPIDGVFASVSNGDDILAPSVLRSGDGSIAGYLVLKGKELRRYNATLSHFDAVAQLEEAANLTILHNGWGQKNGRLVYVDNKKIKSVPWSGGTPVTLASNVDTSTLVSTGTSPGGVLFYRSNTNNYGVPMDGSRDPVLMYIGNTQFIESNGAGVVVGTTGGRIIQLGNDFQVTLMHTFPSAGGGAQACVASDLRYVCNVGYQVASVGKDGSAPFMLTNYYAGTPSAQLFGDRVWAYLTSATSAELVSAKLDGSDMLRFAGHNKIEEFAGGSDVTAYANATFIHQGTDLMGLTNTTSEIKVLDGRTGRLLVNYGAIAASKAATFIGPVTVAARTGGYALIQAVGFNATGAVAYDLYLAHGVQPGLTRLTQHIAAP